METILNSLKASFSGQPKMFSILQRFLVPQNKEKKITSKQTKN